MNVRVPSERSGRADSRAGRGRRFVPRNYAYAPVPTLTDAAPNPAAHVEHEQSIYSRRRSDISRREPRTGEAALAGKIRRALARRADWRRENRTFAPVRDGIPVSGKSWDFLNG